MKKNAPNSYASFIRIIFCLALLGLLAFKGQAQNRTSLNGTPLLNYYNSIGLRLGNQSGLTFKHYTRDANAYEILLTTNLDHKGLIGTFLYELHRNAFDAHNLMWYYGGGGHLGTYRYRDYYNSSNSRYYKSGYFVEFGVDGIIGLEYKFPSIPLALSVDAKPFLNFIGGNAGGVDAALSVRYTF